MSESYILVSGRTLKEAREYCALKQKEVAKVLGVSVQRLHMWEAGKCMPHKISIKKLDEFYKKEIKTIDSMLGWK